MTSMTTAEAAEGRALIAAKIRKEMDRRGLSVRDLASKLGVRPKMVDGWLSGARRFPVSDFLEIADALEVQASELIPETAWWGLTTEGEAYVQQYIVQTDHLAHSLGAIPRVGVEVQLGQAKVVVTAVEARRMAAILIESAERIERGDGFAR